MIQAYFLANYLMQENTLRELTEMAEEFRYTGKSEPFYNFAMNSERELIAERNVYPILNQKSFDVCIENVELVYELNNGLLEQHLDNRDIH